MAKRPIYYDTETTGIKPGKDKIIEIAAYDPVYEKSFCHFINPKIPIPEEATRIHGITDAMVKEAPSFESIAREFASFCEGETVLIAHNNDAFDLPFLQSEYKEASLSFPDWTFFDSLKWARKYRPDLPKHSLQYLREVYKIPENRAHRALDDVKILKSVFSHLIDDLPIDTVLELMKKEGKISRMPFGKHQGKPLDQIPQSYVSWLEKSGAFEKQENETLKEAFQEVGLL